MIARASAIDRRASRMNRTEADYAIVLEARYRRGEIAEYHFEAITLRLGADCRYTPDFLVVLADGTVEFAEVKGFMRGDAQVKIKAAAAIYPFRFRLIRRDGRTGWKIEEVKP